MLVYLISILRKATVCPPPFSLCPPPTIHCLSPLSVCSPFCYLRFFKSDLDSVKSNVGLCNEWIKTSYCVFFPLSVYPPLIVHPPSVSFSVWTNHMPVFGHMTGLCHDCKLATKLSNPFQIGFWGCKKQSWLTIFGNIWAIFGQYLGNIHTIFG